MANKILVARGTKARIEEIKGTLATNELVYSTDTGELGVKKANGNIEYFKNATDIDAIEGEVIQLQTDIADKVDKITGKGLSTNDYTDAEKTKLAGIEQGAEKNTVNSVNGKAGAVVINKSDVGLSNVDNTADLDKPISTATQTALNLKADKTQLNNYVTISTFDMQMLEKLAIKPNGTDLLIIGGKINPLYIDDTSYKVNHPTVNSQAEMLALDVPAGTVVVRLDTPSKELFLLTQLPASTLANWQLVSSNTVVSVAGKTGAVVLGITDISGLTSALNLKLDITTFESQITQLQDDIDSKADKSELFSKNYNDLTNKPALKPVATSGDYNDLTNKPSIPSIPSILSTSEGNAGTSTTQRTINAKNLKDIILNHSPAGARPASDVSAWAKASSKPSYTASEVGARASDWVPSWSQVTSKPSFATVATTGSYTDLSNKPAIPSKITDLTDDVGIVKTSGTQTIKGVKTFQTNLLKLYSDGRNGDMIIRLGDRDSTYGYELEYLGSGSGNNNDLILRADDQNGPSKEVFRIKQDAKLDFKTSPAINGANVATELWVTANTRSNTWTPSWSQVSGKPSTFTPSSHNHSAATPSAAGFMSADDKTKLDGIDTGAQKNRSLATQAQAIAGTNNTTVMTPARVKDAILANPVEYDLTKTKIDTALKGSGVDSIQLGLGATASGGWSTALGHYAQATSTSSTALGRAADAGGDYSAALGHNAYAGGNYSAALGHYAQATSTSSTALGRDAGALGLSSTALGYNAYAGGRYSTALGYNASTGNSENTIRLGGTSLSSLQSRVQLTVTSDIRDKTDIEEVPTALDFIKDLNPITYVSNDRENYISEEQKETETYKNYLMVEDYDKESHSQGTKKGSRRRVGLSAQEVRDKLIEHYGSDNYANVVNDNFVEFRERNLDIPEGLENKLTMSYETLVPFLIKAIQEQQEQIEELKEKNQ